MSAHVNDRAAVAFGPRIAGGLMLLNAGLFFIAFVNAPQRFARVHTSMARDDMFTEYLKTTGSAVFLVPPGVQGEDFVGQGLFDATA